MRILYAVTLAPCAGFAPDLIVLGKVIMDTLSSHREASPLVGDGAPQAAWGALAWRAAARPSAFDVGVVAPVGKDYAERVRCELDVLGANTHGLIRLPSDFATLSEEISYASATGEGG